MTTAITQVPGFYTLVGGLAEYKQSCSPRAGVNWDTPFMIIVADNEVIQQERIHIKRSEARDGTWVHDLYTSRYGNTAADQIPRNRRRSPPAKNAQQRWLRRRDRRELLKAWSLRPHCVFVAECHGRDVYPFRMGRPVLR